MTGRGLLGVFFGIATAVIALAFSLQLPSFVVPHSSENGIRVGKQSQVQSAAASLRPPAFQPTSGEGPSSIGPEDTIGREFTVFSRRSELPQDDAIGREFTVFSRRSELPQDDAIGREFTVQNDPLNIARNDAIAREFTVFTGQSALPQDDAVGREFTVLNAPMNIARTDAIGREFTLFNLWSTAPPDLSGIILQPPSVKGGLTSTGTVTLSAPALSAVSVSLTSGHSSVQVPASVVIPPGQSSATFTILTNRVQQDVPVAITATLGATSVSAQLIVEAYRLGGVSVSPISVKGGVQNATLSVQADAPAPSGGLNVTLSSLAPSAAAVPLSVTIPEGQASASVTVTTSLVDSTHTVTLRGALGSSQREAILTVRPPILQSFTLIPDTVRGGTENSTGTLRIDMLAPQGGIRVRLSSDLTQAQVPAEVTIAAGSDTATFVVTTRPVTANRTATITAICAETTRTATLTLLPPDGNAPETVITSPASGTYFQVNQVPVSYTGSDSETPTSELRFRIRVNEGTWEGPYSGPGTRVLTLQEGGNLVEVKAIDGGGREDPTPAQVAIFVDTQPLVITNLRVEDVSATAALIRWQTNKPATSQVQYRLQGASAWSETSESGAFVVQHGVILHGLDPERDYEYRARSRDRAGRIVFSEIKMFRTLLDDLPPDTAITFGPRNGGSVRPGDVVFVWTGVDNATSVANLRYQYQFDGGPWTPIDPSRDTTVTVRATELRPYTFSVRAHDASNNVDPTPASVTFNVDNTAPDVLNVNVDQIRWNGARVNWTATEPVVALVQYAIAEDGEFLYEARTNQFHVSDSGILSGLVNKTGYRLRVIVQDEAGNQGISEIVRFTTAELRDLGVDKASFGFSNPNAVDGDTVRVHAQIVNFGDVPMTATVAFFDVDADGTHPVGTQQVTIPAYAASPTLVRSDPFLVREGLRRPYAVLQGFSVPDDIANNNGFQKDLVVGAPRDLLSVSLSNPITWPGHQGRFQVNVKNIGSNAHLLRSLTTQGGINAQLVSPLPTQAIQPGEDRDFVFEFSTPSGTAGGTPAAPVRHLARIVAVGATQFAQPFAYEVLAQPAATLGLRVLDASTGVPIQGATIGFTDSNESYVTNADGRMADATGTPVMSPSAADQRTVSAVRSGYQSTTVNLPTDGGPSEQVIVMIPGNALEITEVRVRELTLPEILARGVSINDPVNNWIYDWVVVLRVGACIIRNVEAPRPGASGWGAWGYTGGFIPGDVGVGSATITRRETLGGSQDNIMVTAGQFWILKQFWDATVLVKNNTVFPMENVTLGLTMPAGLALPELNGQTQENPVNIGSLGPSEQGQHNFVVRGDLPGTYRVTGSARSELIIGQNRIPISAPPIVSRDMTVYMPKVHVTFRPPARVTLGGLFTPGIDIRNDTEIALQRVSVVLKPERLVNCSPAGQTEWEIVNLQPGETRTVNVPLISHLEGCVTCVYSAVTGPSVQPSVCVVACGGSGLGGGDDTARGNEEPICLDTSGQGGPGGNAPSPPLSVSTSTSGGSKIKVPDPVATRGYPLINNVHLRTDYNRSDRSLGNGTFSYDIHVTRENTFDPQGVASLRWFLVDGNGDRHDLGPASGRPGKARGMFSRLAQTGNGFVLTQASAPGEIHRAGNFRYEFDAAGRLLKVIDPSGNVQSLSYDPAGLLTQVLDVSSGRKITTLRSNGRITRFVLNGGETWLDLTYANGLLNGVLTHHRAAGLASRIQFNYDSSNRISRITRDGDSASAINYRYREVETSNPNRRRLLANLKLGEFDSMIEWGHTPGPGAVQRVSRGNAKGGIRYFDLDARGNVIRKIEPAHNGAGEPKVETCTYDENNLMTSMSDGIITVRMEYGSNGKLKRFVDGEGNETVFQYRGNNIVEATDSIGRLLAVGYEVANLPNSPTSMTDGEHETWRFRYNAFGQLVRSSNPEGSPSGPTVTEYDENSSGIGFSYRKLVLNGGGNAVSYDDYNPLGDVLRISSYPEGTTGSAQSTSFAYDGLHRLTSVTHPDGRTYRWRFAGRNLAETTDEAGTKTFYDFCRQCGKLHRLRGPMGWTLQWQYDGDRDLRGFIDARGNRTAYDYGQARELTQVTYPDNSTLKYKYDKAGRVRESVNGRNQVREMLYDAAGRIAGFNFPTTGEAPIRFEHNADGTVRRMTDGVGTTSYTYYGNRLVKSVQYDYTGLTQPQRIEYAYYPDQSLSTMTWKNGTSVVASWEYGYNSAGKLAKVQSSLGDSVGYTYDGEGKILAQFHSNGTKTEYDYFQSRGWAQTITHSGPGGVFAQYGLTYDGGQNTVGNLTGVAEVGGGGIEYTYDPLYRLVGESRQGANAYNRAYGYDLAGNLTHVNGSQVATFDAANKFATIVGGSASHDLDGNLLAVHGPGLTALSGMQWDSQSKLTRVTSGGVTRSYAYDGRGFRTVRVRGREKSYFIFNGDSLLGEISEDGTVRAVVNWGADGITSERRDGVLRVFAYGPQGETRHVTNEDGQVVGQALYNAYGVVVAATGSTQTPFLYKGKYGYFSEPEAPLVLCTYRWYSPELTRWLSRDPIGYQGGQNLLAYCASAPTLYRDPLGLQSSNSGTVHEWMSDNCKSEWCKNVDHLEDHDAFIDDLTKKVVKPAVEIVAKSYAGGTVNSPPKAFKSLGQWCLEWFTFGSDTTDSVDDKKTLGDGLKEIREKYLDRK